MSLKLLTLWLLLWAYRSHGQYVLTNGGARNEALASIAATASDVWSIWLNPSGLTEVKSFSASCGARQVARVPAQLRSALIVLPTSMGSFAGGVSGFGDDLYSEQVISLGAAHQIGSTSIGVRGDLFQLLIADSPARRTWGISLGFRTKISSQVTIAARAQNINLPQWADGQALPVVLNAGISFRPTSSFSLFSELEKHHSETPSWKGAVEYHLRNRFYARTGYTLFPAAAFAGAGLYAWKLGFDYAVRFGSLTGPAHTLSVAIRFKEK